MRTRRLLWITSILACCFSPLALAVPPDPVALQTACDANDIRACAVLSNAYLRGEGVEKDLSKAAVLTEKACNGGDLESCHYLALLYTGSESVGVEGFEKNPARALTFWEKACNYKRDGSDRDEFSRMSCVNLGLRYQYGHDTKIDLAKAVSFYQKACGPKGTEDTQACYQLGDMYAKGEGVEKDLAKAAFLFGAVCDYGFHEFTGHACFGIGNLYAKGNGVEKDLVKAAALYERACDKGGSSDACHELGIAYASGLGVPQDFDKSSAFSEKACDHGRNEACYDLAYDYSNEKNLKKAIALLEISCDRKHAPSCLTLGFFLQDHAMEIFERACSLGDAMSCTEAKFIQTHLNEVLP